MGIFVTLTGPSWLIGAPTPTWLFVLDYFVLSIFLVHTIIRGSIWFKNRKRVSLTLFLGVFLLFLAQVLVTLGLGHRVIDPVFSWRYLSFGSGFVSLLYCYFVLFRCTAFSGFLPSWCEDDTLQRRLFLAGVALLHVVLMWPFYVFTVALDSMEKEHHWMKNYHLLGFLAWASIVALTDVVMGNLLLRFVRNIRNHEDESVKQDLSAQFWNASGAFLLLLVVTTDFLDSYTIVRFQIIEKQYPSINDLNLLTCLFLSHIFVMFLFLLNLNHIARQRPQHQKWKKLINNSSNTARKGDVELQNFDEISLHHSGFYNMTLMSERKSNSEEHRNT
jgi:hypothetical protein